jgi:predicted DCC family thiol-disulfide oxidoreductase YuxK
VSKVTVWYDAACPLRRLDLRRRISIVDAFDPSSTCPLDRTTVLSRFHASEDEQDYSGAAAFAVMWRAVPLLRPLRLLARNTVVLRLPDAAYV